MYISGFFDILSKSQKIYTRQLEPVMFDEEGYVLENAYAPEILNHRSLWKVFLTFGWRF